MSIPIRATVIEPAVPSKSVSAKTSELEFISARLPEAKKGTINLPTNDDRIITNEEFCCSPTRASMITFATCLSTKSRTANFGAIVVSSESMCTSLTRMLVEGGNSPENPTAPLWLLSERIRIETTGGFLKLGGFELSMKRTAPSSMVRF